MDDCHRLEGRLSDLALGERPSDEQQAHLARCPACGERLEERRRSITRADRLLSEALQMEPSPALMAGVRARLAEAPKRHALGPRALVFAAAAVVVLVAGLALVLRKPHAPLAEPTLASAPRPVVTASGRRLEASAPARPDRGTGEPAPRGRAANHMVPEILVQPGQIAALAGLVQMFNRQAQSPSYIRVDPPGASRALDQPLDVDIRPLVVPPLESVALPDLVASFERPTDLSQRSES